MLLFHPTHYHPLYQPNNFYVYKEFKAHQYGKTCRSVVTNLASEYDCIYKIKCLNLVEIKILIFPKLSWGRKMPLSVIQVAKKSGNMIPCV